MTMKLEIALSIITLLLFNYIPYIRGNVNVKCCKPDQAVFSATNNTSSFKCDNKTVVRYQAFFRNYDFFDNETAGSCVDYFENTNKTAVFAIDESKKISKKDYVTVDFFHKCCPLGFRYNTTLHSCVKKNTNDDQNIGESFLKDDSFINVGLPHCNIISDRVVDSLNEVESLLKEKNIPKDKFCVDSTANNSKYVLRMCEQDYQICGQIRCIHKCCPDGQSFINGPKCRDTLKHGVDLHASQKIQDQDAPFVIIHGITLPIYVLHETRYHFFLDRFGVFSSYMNKTDSYDSFDASNQSYCIEHAFKEKKMNGYKLFAREIKPPLEIKFAVTRWIKIVSCVFLLLTIAVYLILPKMRNLFGKILLSYSIATFMFFFFLAFSQFYYYAFSDSQCKTVGFLSILSSIWSFTWLHIMCIDIWFSFGTPRTLSGPLQKNEWKRLFQYSLYGWGFPMFWVGMIAFFESTGLPYMFQPFIGSNKCYMENTDTRAGNYAYLTFITIPLLIQQIVNTILFIKTIRYCLRIRAEIQKMNDAKRSEYNASKERSSQYHVLLFCRLGLIMKLAVIMGVLFLFETVSSMYDFQRTSVTMYIEVVWDGINCSQGVFIFIIFICKKKVFKDLCEKLHLYKLRKTSVSSNATTQVSLHNMEENKKRDTSSGRESTKRE